MLVLTHKRGEYVEVGATRITVLEIRGGQVKLGYEAPPEVLIRRDKLIRKMAEQQGHAPPETPTANPPPESSERSDQPPARKRGIFGLIIGGKSA